MRNWFMLSLLLWAACGGGDAPGADAEPAPDGATLGGIWERLPDVGDGAIQEIGVAELDGKIYVLGGFSRGGQVLDDVRVYDIAGSAWSQAAPLPRPVHHANVAAAGGKLYVLGSLVTNAFTQDGASWVYDPAEDEWTGLAPMNADSARGSAAVGVIGDVIYLAGGYRNGASVSLVSRYHTATNTWEHDLAPLPAPRDHLVGAAVGGTLYAISGRAGGIGAVNARVDAYDPDSDTWSARAPIPTARGGMAAAVVHDRIVVIGGEGSSQASGVFPEAEIYDPAGDCWAPLPPMPTPRHGMGAAAHEGTVYVPGGATVAGFAAVDTFEAFTVALEEVSCSG